MPEYTVAETKTAYGKSNKQFVLHSTPVGTKTKIYCLASAETYFRFAKKGNLDKWIGEMNE